MAVGQEFMIDDGIPQSKIIPGPNDRALKRVRTDTAAQSTVDFQHKHVAASSGENSLPSPAGGL
ncbi:MAG TPA: hypothetical protein DCG12_08260 [Planctomycetaceae bacterium]|nr:hypothetical protein [Planctomycetaceae bacterium]